MSTAVTLAQECCIVVLRTTHHPETTLFGFPETKYDKNTGKTKEL